MYLVGYNIDTPSDLVVEFMDGEIEDETFYHLLVKGMKKKDATEKRLNQMAEDIAKEFNLTHWVYDEGEGEILTIWYNAGDKPATESWCDDNHGYELAIEDAPKSSYDYVFIYSNVNEIENITLPNWKKRDNVVDRDQAIKYLAVAVNGPHSKKRIDDMNKFAEKHDVPFCIELHHAADQVFKANNPMWDSSSAYC